MMMGLFSWFGCLSDQTSRQTTAAASPQLTIFNSLISPFKTHDWSRTGSGAIRKRTDGSGSAKPVVKPSCRQATRASRSSKLEVQTVPQAPLQKICRPPKAKPLTLTLPANLTAPSSPAVPPGFSVVAGRSSDGRRVSLMGMLRRQVSPS